MPHCTIEGPTSQEKNWVLLNADAGGRSARCPVASSGAWVYQAGSGYPVEPARSGSCTAGRSAPQSAAAAR
jgi:hypothetical protein